jgi:hypothetical protein
VTVRYRQTGGYTPSEDFTILTAANHDKTAGHRRALIYCHGAGSIAPVDPSPDARVDLELYAARGYVVGIATLSGLFNWGNDASRVAIDNLLTYMNASYGAVVTSPLFIADSMGCPTALWWAVNNASRLGAAQLRVPAIALQHFHDGNVGGLAAGMETAYTNLAGLVAAYPTHDGLHPTMQATINSLGLPAKMRVLYNPPDPLVAAADVLAFQAATGVETIAMAGPSHAPWGYFDMSAQLGFLQAH